MIEECNFLGKEKEVLTQHNGIEEVKTAKTFHCTLNDIKCPGKDKCILYMTYYLLDEKKEKETETQKRLREKIEKKEKDLMLYNRAISTNTCPECAKDLDNTIFGSDGLRHLHCSHCDWDGGMVKRI